jgi:lipopolysaccharide/colanic/teichoic acid biosynthesis glycosyltransferase
MTFDVVGSFRHHDPDKAGAAALTPAPGGAAQDAPHRVTKRGLDVLVAGTALVVTMPLLIAVYLLVRLSTPGPGVFRQVRVGRAGKPFDILKFRTMQVGCDDDVHREYVTSLLAGTAEQHSGLYKLGADDRVTRVGSVLRRLSIDELPQLINVLRGDMSLVGPRPVLPWEATMFPDWAAPRHSVRPGVTGLWQVSGRNRLTMLQGLRLDVDYVERQSALLDLIILIRTIPAVLAAGGR